MTSSLGDGCLLDIRSMFLSVLPCSEIKHSIQQVIYSILQTVSRKSMANEVQYKTYEFYLTSFFYY